MKKAVIFDLDGTLLNTLPDIANAMTRVLAKNGLPTHPERDYRLLTGNGARVLTKRALGDACTAELEERVCRQYAQDYGANNLVDTAPYPGVPEMLRALAGHGLQVCVFSNKDDTDVQPVVQHFWRSTPADMRGAPGVPSSGSSIYIAAAGTTPDGLCMWGYPD